MCDTYTQWNVTQLKNNKIVILSGTRMMFLEIAVLFKMTQTHKGECHTFFLIMDPSL